MPGFYLRASGKTEGGAETEGVSPMTVSLEDLRAEALALLDGLPEGPELDMRTSALIELVLVSGLGVHSPRLLIR
jgi:hypothetical protein